MGALASKRCVSLGRCRGAFPASSRCCLPGPLAVWCAATVGEQGCPGHFGAASPLGRVEMRPSVSGAFGLDDARGGSARLQPRCPERAFHYSPPAWLRHHSIRRPAAFERASSSRPLQSKRQVMPSRAPPLPMLAKGEHLGTHGRPLRCGRRGRRIGPGPLRRRRRPLSHHDSIAAATRKTTHLPCLVTVA